MAKRWTIVSGGQTGVDRAALDAARALGLAYGGFVPRDRRTEDGALPDDYEGMIETKSARYPARTRRNVETADATLIVTRGQLDGGTLLTVHIAERLGKPLLCLDFASQTAEAAARKLAAWLETMPPGRLNVAGPRESESPGIHAAASAYLSAVLIPPHPTRFASE